MEKESHSSQTHEKNTSTRVFTPTNINAHLSTHIHLLTRMLRYTHELTYADSKELFSKRQEILEETEMSLFLFLFPSLHDAYFCMRELYSALLFECIVIKVTRIKSNKFVAFWLVADGRVFDIQSIYLIFPLTKHNSLVTWASWSPKWRLSKKNNSKSLAMLLIMWHLIVFWAF